MKHRRVARVLGVTQEVRLIHQFETGCLDLLAQRALLDPVQCLADIGAIAGTRGMVGDHQNAAGA